MTDPLLSDLTEADFDNGYKDVAVNFRNGKPGVVRVKAINHRDAATLTAQMPKEGDPWQILYAAIDDRAILDRIEPFSATQLLHIAYALLFGPQFARQMEAAGLAWAQQAFS
jgi:hypothetical protein